MALRRYLLTNHNRGDRFSRRITVTENGIAVNLTGATVAAELRSNDYVLISTLSSDTTLLASGIITVFLNDTTSWTLSDEERPNLLDIKITLSGAISRTETIGVVVDREITA